MGFSCLLVHQGTECCCFGWFISCWAGPGSCELRTVDQRLIVLPCNWQRQLWEIWGDEALCFSPSSAFVGSCLHRFMQGVSVSVCFTLADEGAAGRCSLSPDPQQRLSAGPEPWWPGRAVTGAKGKRSSSVGGDALQPKHDLSGVRGATQLTSG